MLQFVPDSLEAARPLFVALKRISVIVFLVGTMTALGTQLTLDDIRRTVREHRLVGRWLVANLLVVPLFAAILAYVTGLGSPLLLGLLLVSTAPGAPFIPLFVTIANEDSHEAIRLTSALVVVAALGVPLLVATALLVLRIESEFIPWRFHLPLLSVLVAPLFIGSLLRERDPSFADRITNPLTGIAHVALLLTLVLIVLLNPGDIVRVIVSLFGSGAILVWIIFILGTIGIGWVGGGPTARSRRILALATAGRNVGIAIFIAASAFTETHAESAIFGFTVFMLGVSVGVAWYWRRHPLDTGSVRGEAVTEPRS